MGVRKKDWCELESVPIDDRSPARPPMRFNSDPRSSLLWERRSGALTVSSFHTRTHSPIIIAYADVALVPAVSRT